VLVAGFGVPTSSMLPLARGLRAAGHRPRIARTGLNVDCGERTVSRLLDSLDGPVALVGHSRGGQLARVAAVRRPDLVTRLVTVGTPWSIGPPDRPGVARVTRAVRAARRHGLPLLASIECADGPCCEAYRADLRRRPDAPWVALWSSADRVAGDDARPPIEATSSRDVGGSHLGLVLSHRGRRAIAEALMAPMS